MLSSAVLALFLVPSASGGVDTRVADAAPASQPVTGQATAANLSLFPMMTAPAALPTLAFPIEPVPAAAVAAPPAAAPDSLPLPAARAASAAIPAAAGEEAVNAVGSGGHERTSGFPRALPGAHPLHVAARRNERSSGGGEAGDP
ncbi:MAG: hypothetical protein ACHQ2Z_00035 [Elusimicrobiota bacterium]